MSSKTLASTEPEGKAEELDHPWLFTASMVEFVCFRRMNSDSTPMRKERFSSFLAFLEGVFFWLAEEERVGKRGRGRGSYALDDSTKDRTWTEIDLVR